MIATSRSFAVGHPIDEGVEAKPADRAFGLRAAGANAHRPQCRSWRHEATIDASAGAYLHRRSLGRRVQRRARHIPVAALPVVPSPTRIEAASATARPSPRPSPTPPPATPAPSDTRPRPRDPPPVRRRRPRRASSTSSPPVSRCRSSRPAMARPGRAWFTGTATAIRVSIRTTAPTTPTASPSAGSSSSGRASSFPSTRRCRRRVRHPRRRHHLRRGRVRWSRTVAARAGRWRLPLTSAVGPIRHSRSSHGCATTASRPRSS